MSYAQVIMELAGMLSASQNCTIEAALRGFSLHDGLIVANMADMSTQSVLNTLAANAEEAGVSAEDLEHAQKLVMQSEEFLAAADYESISDIEPE